MEKRVLLIADVSNLYYCLDKKYNGKLDYLQLLDYAKNFGQLYRSIAYGAQMKNEATSFCNFIEMHGFELRYKRPKVVGDIRKADWDVGMTLDIVRILPSVDVVLLATADGDMAPVIEYIHEQGKLCNVIGCNISYELKEKANRVYEIPSSMLDIKTLDSKEIKEIKEIKTNEPNNDPQRPLPSQLVRDGDGRLAQASD